MTFRRLIIGVPLVLWTLLVCVGLVFSLVLPLAVAHGLPHQADSLSPSTAAAHHRAQGAALRYLEEQGVWKPRSLKQGPAGSPQIHLQHRSTMGSPGGYKIVTFQPHLGSVPIINRKARVYLDGHHRPLLSTGSLELPDWAGLSSANRRIPALDGPQKAVEAARNLLGVSPSRLRGEPLVREVRVADEELIHNAWQVIMPMDDYRDVAFVFSGSTGLILSAGPVSFDAMGRVYATNPAVSRLMEVELPDLYGDQEGMAGAHARVFSCQARGNACQGGVLAVPDAQGNYLFDPQLHRVTSQDPFAEVQAYYHVNRIKGYLAGLGLDPALLPEFPVIVNIPGMANAAYSPYDGALLFGVHGINYAYDSDVVYHEYVHGVIDQINPMDLRFDHVGINYIPAAMNEGMADTFSVLLSGDPVLGEYVGGRGGIRRMDGNKVCPLDQIGLLHDDGMLWGQAAWELGDLLDGDEEARGALLWDVLNLVEPEEGFLSFAQVTVDVAAQRFGEEVAHGVRELMERRGLFDCGRVVTLEPGIHRDGLNLSGEDLFYVKHGMGISIPGFLQFKMVIPEGIEYAEVEFGAVTAGLKQADYRLHMRKDIPVGIRINNYGDMRVEADRDFTPMGNRFRVRGNYGSNLDPGEYYFATVNEGESIYQFSIRYILVPARVEEPEGESCGVADCGVDDTDDPEEAGDGGVGDGDGDGGFGDGGLLPSPELSPDGGCGCSMGGLGARGGQGEGAGSGASGSWAWALVGWLAVVPGWRWGRGRRRAR